MDNPKIIVSVDIEDGRFQALPSFTDLQMSVMPVVHLKDGAFRGLGTCFAISNQGLCLTARHVFDEAFPKTTDGMQLTAEEGQLFALYIGGEPEVGQDLNGGLLPIVRVHRQGETDVALLQLSLPTNSRTGELLRMPAVRIGVAPPRLGSRCTAVGYHKMRWTAGDHDLTVEQSFAFTEGVVEELHIPRRDSFNLSFPCFRTSAHYPPGMSGAPIFAEDGYVRGVVCSEFETLEQGDDHLSYASIVGIALLLQLEGRRGTSVDAEKLFLADFVSDGAVVADLTGTAVERGTEQLTVSMGNTTFIARL